MQQVLLFLSSLVLLWAVTRWLSARDHEPAVHRAPPRRQDPVRPHPAPHAALQAVSARANPASEEALRSRLRDRYVAARFPGIVSSSADLTDTDAVITIARQLFEEDRGDDAREFLLLAIEEAPACEALRLARLEIVFLQRDAPSFAGLAREFRETHPQSSAWTEILRLGHALAPSEPLFAKAPGERRHERYGAWPDTPNWIRASWDLTPETHAIDFHNALRNERRAAP